MSEIRSLRDRVNVRSHCDPRRRWRLLPAPARAVGGAPAARLRRPGRRRGPRRRGALRLAGTVEATRSRSVLVPRLAGQVAPTLVITVPRQGGRPRRAGRPHRRVRPPGADPRRDRAPGRTGRPRRPDSEEAIRARRSPGRATKPNWPRPSATSSARRSRRARTSSAAHRGREEHAGGRAGDGAPRAAQGDVRAQAAGGGGRDCGFSKSSASGPSAP